MMARANITDRALLASIAEKAETEAIGRERTPQLRSLSAYLKEHRADAISRESNGFSDSGEFE